MPATLTLSEPFVDRVRREATEGGFDSEQALLEEALQARRDRLEAEAERREILAAVATAQAQFDRGEGYPIEEAVRRLRAKHGVGPQV